VSIKLVLPRHFLLKCLYQARKMSGHVFVCYGFQFYIFLLFDFEIVLTGIYCFPFFLKQCLFKMQNDTLLHYYYEAEFIHD
jgi:hypothetical protein